MITQNQRFVQLALHQLLSLANSKSLTPMSNCNWAEGYRQAQEDMKFLMKACFALIVDTDGNLLPPESEQ